MRCRATRDVEPPAAQQAAKVIDLVVAPLGLDATDFDPSDDSAAPVDLVAALQAGAGPGSDYAGAALRRPGLRGRGPSAPSS